MSTYHVPVLLQSVLTALHIQPGKLYVDATVGGGGHAQAIVEKGGKVLGLDQDPDALAACPRLDNLVLARSNFIHLGQVVEEHAWTPLSGILIDLGVSLHQLKTAHRGFSFQFSGPLDMRMDPDLPHTAATLVNSLSEKQLSELFERYGEERSSKSIARRIVSARPIESTEELAALVGTPDQNRRIFQALRIAVNDELGALIQVLPECLALLEKGGRLAILTFHSLEDRIVKDQFREWEKAGKVILPGPQPVVADEVELEKNPQSRSAKLRYIEKI